MSPEMCHQEGVSCCSCPLNRLSFFGVVLCCKESGCQMLGSEILVFHEVGLGSPPKECSSRLETENLPRNADCGPGPTLEKHWPRKACPQV